MDHTDKELVGLLSKDGRASISSLAEHLKLTRPTVRSRINSLVKKGILRVAGLINAEQAPDLIVALVAIHIESRGMINKQVRELAQMEQVHWAAVVTGRFDIIAEVVVSGGMKELNRFTTRILPRLGKVTRSETFVVMEAHNKWLCQSDTTRNWWGEDKD